MRSIKIGVFDSGVGGITVLSELRNQFPKADYVYLGDTANVPYGNKSAAQIQRLSVDCAEQLKSLAVDVVLVACNSASSHALAEIRDVMGEVPVLGMVEPGVNAVIHAIDARKNLPVLVLATRATVQSGVYSRVLRARGAFEIHEQACPLLVPMIEEGWIDHPILRQTLDTYVAPYLSMRPGVALLGCTHYPWIQAAFERSLPGWKIVNSARAVTEALSQTSLGEISEAGGDAPSMDWIFTDPDAIPAFARDLIRRISGDAPIRSRAQPQQQPQQQSKTVQGKQSCPV
jgi:glutamate racemase